MSRYTTVSRAVEKFIDEWPFEERHGWRFVAALEDMVMAAIKEALWEAGVSTEPRATEPEGDRPQSVEASEAVCGWNGEDITGSRPEYLPGLGLREVASSARGLTIVGRDQPDVAELMATQEGMGQS